MKYYLPDLRGKITIAIAEQLKIDASRIGVENAEGKHGADLAVPCFSPASQLGRSAQEVAEELAGQLRIEDVAKLEAKSGFLDIWLEPMAMAKRFRENWDAQPVYGNNDLGQSRHVIVDFIGLNLSKPFSVGHLRPTLQGWAMIQLYRALGYEVIGDSHLGDWGTPFGMWVVGFEKWGSESTLAKDGVYELGRLYVKFRDVAKENPDLMDEAKAWLKKLEDNDPQAVAYRDRFYKLSMAHATAMLDKLEIRADENLGEAFYIESAQKYVDELVKSGEAEQQADGSIIVRLDEFDIETPLLLRKGDGSALYATSDLETIRYRVNRWNPVKIIYCVGAEQQLHFRQVFAFAHKLGLDQDCELVHPWFGTVDEINPQTRSRTKMSSRKDTALLEHLLKTAHAKASAIAKNQEMDQEDIDAIAVGAIKFTDFAQARQTNILFDWDRMFSLQGFSGPYIQYAAVRAQSILNKLGPDESAPPLNDNYDWIAERELLLQLLKYPESVEDAAMIYEPHKIADYAFALAKAWNKYYEETPIAKAPDEIRPLRVWLLKALSHNFAHALGLLGIKVPSKM